MIYLNLKFVEQIEDLIATAQDRFDEIMRELHRHHFGQSRSRSLTSPAQVEGEPKKIAGILVTMVPHDQ